MVEIYDIFAKLCGSSKLERDRSELELIKEIKKCSDYTLFINWIDSKFNEEKSLENSLGSLTVVKVLLIHSTYLSNDYLHHLSKECIKYHQHNEYRVRMLAGECIGELCRLLGLSLFSELINNVKEGIFINLKSHRYVLDDTHSIKFDKRNVINEINGWQTLETWIRCFQYMIVGLGKSVEGLIDQELFDAVLQTIGHINRFVRESGFEVLGTIAEHSGFTNDNKNYLHICNVLGIGLCDNWSQVRMAASIATRKFLISNEPLSLMKNEIFKIFLPKICLNRFYTAEGVKLYNQETWRMVVGDRGKQLLEENIEETLQFYIEQCKADNHGVREAACCSISEIVIKLNAVKIRSYSSRLLDALIICFSDENWPVRDAAGMACGHIVSAFPTESKQYRQDVLIPLFLNNVIDCISSVREGGAYCVASVLGVFNSSDTDYLKVVLDFIYYHLENIKGEKEETVSIDQLNERKIVRCDSTGYDDEGRHSDQQVFSCETLAPKILKGRSKGCQFRTSELWERADGCILLIGEMSVQVKESHKHMSQLIPALIKAVNYHHYSHHVYLLATACNIIAKLYEGLGKQMFKRFLDDVLGLLDVGISSDCSFVATAVENNIRFLAVKLGSNILKGRIEMYSPGLLERTKHLLI